MPCSTADNHYTIGLQKSRSPPISHLREMRDACRMVAGVNIRGKQTTYVVDVASNFACVFHFAEGALHSCENRQFRARFDFYWRCHRCALDTRGCSYLITGFAVIWGQTLTTFPSVHFIVWREKTSLNFSGPRILGAGVLSKTSQAEKETQQNIAYV